jgi:PPM family protein phosphatase
MTFNAHKVELAFAARTDTGRVRKRNEDAIAVSLQHGIAILADGMGGYNAGDVASSIAVATMMESLVHHLPTAVEAGRSRSKQIRQILTDAVAEANRAIHAAAHDNQHYSGMGTTVVAALFHHDKALVAHAGDSRLYRWRNGGLALLTRDHSLMQEQLEAGLVSPEEARTSPTRNLITRALGVEDGVDVEVHEHATIADDIYVLCSDGLSDMLTSEEIAGLLAHNDSDIGAACDALVWQANAKGGRDNVSVILAAVKSVQAEEPERLVGRLLNWMR